MVTTLEIRNFGLFNGLNEAELEEIAKICERRTCEVGSVIFDPENPCEDLFIVEANNDAIQIEIPLGVQQSRIVIHTLSKGETFGWAALGPQHIKTAIARCLDRTSLIAIKGKQLLSLFEDNPRMGFIVMKNLCDIISLRLAYTTVAFRHEIRKIKVPV